MWSGLEVDNGYRQVERRVREFQVGGLTGAKAGRGNY